MARAMRVKKPGGLDNLYLDAAPAPPPGKGEISVRIRASSLNYHDYLVVKGMIPAEEGRIPMSDGAGEVTAVGEGVREFAVGDRVISTFFPDWLSGTPTQAKLRAVPGDRTDGCAREEVTAPATSFTRAPKHMSFEEAATLPCAGLTAWRALIVEGGLKSGETVLVQGTGGVSIFALQIAKAAGATVIATSSSDAKIERLKALGADCTINYRTTPNWGAEAQKFTQGRGVDHVVEIGGAGTLTQSISACRIGGHISMIGVLAGFAGEVNTAMIMGKQIRLIGITVGAREHQEDMVRGMEATGLKPVLDKTFPLETLADAFRHEEGGTHFGKIVITI
ncbi:MAG: NAD(P)-dependent alcohol dehydrogenase [Hydrogenophilaceae bacterium]|nr:NAD(P)-dependent alcohol dehydrogenase [Hydrogenophilaceae bacterium]